MTILFCHLEYQSVFILKYRALSWSLHDVGVVNGWFVFEIGNDDGRGDGGKEEIVGGDDGWVEGKGDGMNDDFEVGNDDGMNDGGKEEVGGDDG